MVQPLCYCIHAGREYVPDVYNGRAFFMRGYFTGAGFYGLVDGKYILFSSESEYYEYMEETREAS